MYDHPFVFSPSEPLRGHRHHRLHLCVVLRGGFVERRGSSWRECGAGTVRVSPAGTEHHLHATEEGAAGRVVEPRPAAMRYLVRPLKESVFMALPAIVDRLDADLDPVEAEGIHLALIARATRSDPHARPPRWLAQLHAEVGFESTPSLEEAARRARRHPSHLARSFREWYGRSMGEHLRACRAIEAARRLRETDQPVAGIAHDLGFTDQAHLTRVFRAFYGSPPARYRRRAS